LTAQDRFSQKGINTMKRIRALLLSLLIVMLMVSVLPIQAAQAQGATTSDLAITLVSIPKHAKACQTFEAVYTVTNLGPDPASNLHLTVWIPDAYNEVEVIGLPDSLAVGQTAAVSVIIDVVAFVPGETRRAWVGVTLISDSFEEPSTDPNPDNSTVTTEMKIIGKHIYNCG
jgi:hypothetical protein